MESIYEKHKKEKHLFRPLTLLEPQGYLTCLTRGSSHVQMPVGAYVPSTTPPSQYRGLTCHSIRALDASQSHSCEAKSRSVFLGNCCALRCITYQFLRPNLPHSPQGRRLPAHSSPNHPASTTSAAAIAISSTRTGGRRTPHRTPLSTF